MLARLIVSQTIVKATLVVMGLMAFTPSQAANIQEILQQALESDAEYQGAVAANLAVRESEPQALAVLLPDASLQASTNGNDLHGSGVGTGGYNSHGYTLSISQPVFHWDRRINLRQAKSSIKQSNAELDAARQELIMRVADRYFDLLKAGDNLEFASKTRTAIAQQLNQAEQRFEVGLIAITDVEEAKARHDLAVADEISARNGVANAREALREITAQYHQTVAPLSADRMPLVKPEPADIDQWTDTALTQNRDVIAAQYGSHAARDEIKRKNAGHYPTLDLVGSRVHSSSNGGVTGGGSTMTDSIGLQLNVPIYQGGGTASSVREARHLYRQTTHALEQARRAAQRQTREAYLGVVDHIATVKAMKQALTSTETALRATEAGFQAGTRTTVDVLDAQKETFKARRDHQAVRYDYILNSLSLKQAAGTLSDADLAQVNSWLD